MFRIALAQINPIVGDLKGNRAKIVEYIRNAKGVGTDMVVFPELIITGYPPEDLLLKEHFVRDNIKALQGLIKETKGIAAVIGFVDMDKNKRLYNAAAVIDNGRLQGVYYKQELPNYGVFDEKRYFTPGTKNRIFTVAGVRVGVNICEDIWVDGAAYKKQHQLGAQVLVNISSSPYDIDKFERRQKLLTARAKEVKSFICYANVVGGQDELVFDGGSFVINPKGKIIGLGKQLEEDLVVTDLNLTGKKQAEYLAGTSFTMPLNKLERIYKALVVGTRDYMGKNGFKKAVIGLSGGIDSSLVAAIAVDAIGKDNVIGVTMPSRFTSKGTFNDAKAFARKLGIKCIEIPIEGAFKAFLGALSKEFARTKPNIAEENIQARTRGTLLMALSNKFGWLVLTTGNKSEVAVGYCTLYGDMSGGFAVIKDVLKTQVYELAKLVNKQQGNVIPQSVIKRAPTAELRPNQKDQDSLPPYNTLDSMLKEYVEAHHSFDQMKRKNSEALVKKVINLVDQNEYKRRQAPPGIKITHRAFGKDWRLPITNKYKEYD